MGWPTNVIGQLSCSIFGKYDVHGAGVLRQKEYEAYCIDVYFCLELSNDEWNEQCNGLGVKPSEGIDFATFTQLYSDFGRDVVADSVLIFKAADFKAAHGTSLLRMGLLLSHVFA
jgi:hypothetical protein